MTQQESHQAAGSQPAGPPSHPTCLRKSYHAMTAADQHEMDRLLGELEDSLEETRIIRERDDRSLSSTSHIW